MELKEPKGCTLFHMEDLKLPNIRNTDDILCGELAKKAVEDCWDYKKKREHVWSGGRRGRGGVRVVVGTGAGQRK